MPSHPFAPVFDARSRLCILGSFPSVRSREEGFYYGHPQNRFWRVLSRLYGETLPQTIPEKKAFLLRHGIALWDVYQSCEIHGSSDSSITSAVLNDLDWLAARAPIERFYLNGKEAYRAFTRGYPEREGICLPSTSAANAAWSLDRLTEAWSSLLQNPSSKENGI